MLQDGVQQRFASPPPKQSQRSPYIIPVSASSPAFSTAEPRLARGAGAAAECGAGRRAQGGGGAARPAAVRGKGAAPPPQQHQQQQHMHMQQRPVAHSCAVLARQPVKDMMAT